ncbi:MAG: response regulator, partial [Verrucomicrobiota bacterium]
MRNTSFYQNRARMASVTKFFLSGEAGFNRNGLKKGILVVEDDAHLRAFLGGLLTAEGYQVFEAASEGHARAVWREHFLRIDLLFTDICIPYQTTGVELAKKLRMEKPWLKVFYTSGFSATIVENDGVKLVENVNFFCKPYPSRKLLDALTKTFKALPRMSA